MLINRDGKAVVCGFDLFKFSNVRWVIQRSVSLCLTWECMIYSRQTLVLDGLLQKGTQLLVSLPQLRKQTSGRLGCSAWKCLQERTLITNTRTYILLVCWLEAPTPSTLSPRQLVSVPKCGSS
jgi:hypothetical protein